MQVYPTLVIRGTGLYELWKKGLYHNYEPTLLIDLVARILALVPPWVRVYRIQVSWAPAQLDTAPSSVFKPTSLIILCPVCKLVCSTQLAHQDFVRSAFARQSFFATVVTWYNFILAASMYVTQLQCDADMVFVELQLHHRRSVLERACCKWQRLSSSSA